jgi:transketolase
MTDTAKREQHVNAIRFLAVDAIQKANSGHPGMPMGSAPMAYALWTEAMKYNPENGDWFDRDRFVLSAGHGSMLLYSMLHLTGYPISMDDLKNFRQWKSPTAGHPERGDAPGIEITTGPLGQGFATGVGLAVAEAHLAARFNKPDHTIVDHYTYAICSDGDLMEGVASEAASIAGEWGLNKLIYLYDDNNITLGGSAEFVFREDRTQRFESYGWQVITVENGNDAGAIIEAIREAKAETGKPSIIRVKTTIGFGSPNMQGTADVHGAPLGDDEIRATKENLGWPADKSFYVPDDTLEYYRQAAARGAKSEAEWNLAFAAYQKAYPAEAAEFELFLSGDLPEGWDADIPTFEADAKGEATRKVSGAVMNAIAPNVRNLIGGSADLNPSTNTALKGMGDFANPADEPKDKMAGTVGGGWGYDGRNLGFGVREHAMAAIGNGIAAHGGLIAYVSTFFVFCDYLRPSLRLAAIMKLQNIGVFTHDSIALGEDGTTHQPIEQLASLRAMPDLTVIRPCDANETAEAWKVAIESRNRPSVLVLSRQNVPTLDRSVVAAASGLRNGAYVLADSTKSVPDAILIASGSEVAIALDAKELLAAKGADVRVVSMPSWDLFDAQPDEYRASVLPPGVTKRLAVEAGATMGWHKYVGSEGDVVGMDRFGASAPAKKLLEEFGFTSANIADRTVALVNG